jgi:hypothetical protein
MPWAQENKEEATLTGAEACGLAAHPGPDLPDGRQSAVPVAGLELLRYVEPQAAG